MPFTKEAASLHATPGRYKLHLSAQSSLTSEIRHSDALTHILNFCAYSGLQNTLKNTLNQFMHLVRLMWRSASESKPVHRRYSRLIRIISAVSSWFRHRSSHELNSLNSIRLMWSTASETGLRVITKSDDRAVGVRLFITSMITDRTGWH